MPGEGSSSPNAKSVVVSLERRGAGGEIVRVRLSDGSSFILHAEIVAREAIRAERELDPDQIVQLQSRSEILFARQSALSLLARAPHTRKGLTRKLEKRGFEAQAISLAVARMVELGYLDDRAFAEGWARARVDSRREGGNALYRGLIQRGVARAVAQEVVAEVCPEEVEIEKARALAEGLAAKKAVARLTARGFRSRTIARILREMNGQARGASGE